MIKKAIPFLGLLITLIFNINCSNDDTYENEIELTDDFKIESYHGVYAQYSNQLILDPNHDNLVKFEYDQNDKIIKRTGDILYTSIGGLLSDSLYTTINYFDNKAHLIKGISYLGYSIPQHENVLTFNAQNRILQKITIRETQSSIELERDTINYSYTNGKLSSFIKTYNRVSQGTNWEYRYFEESNLYYTNGNLDSIVTIYSYKPNFVDYTVLQKKETQIFEAYDNSQNPFRKLQLFNETFNRSLSNNNFTEYRKTANYYDYPNNDFYQTPILSQTYEVSFQNWDFAYDLNGELIYDQF